MAVLPYPFFYAEMLRGNVDWLGQTFSAVSLRSTHSPNAAHKRLSDVTAADRNAHAAVNLANKTVTIANAALGADNIAIPSGTGAECGGILIFRNTGTDTTSTLVCALTGAEYTYTPATSKTLTWFGAILNMSPTGNTYDRGIYGIATGEFNVLSADLRVQLIDTADYTFSQSHTSMADVPVAARVGDAVAISGKLVSDSGVFSSSVPVNIPNVTGDATEAAIVYLHTGTDSTARPLSYHAGAGIELTPNGQSVDVSAPNGWLSP